MKKTLQLLLVSILTALVLTACGQGESPVEPEESGSGIDSDHNEELIEQEEIAAEEEVVEPVTEDLETKDEETTEVVTEDTIHSVELYFADTQVEEMYKVETTVEAAKDEVSVKTLEAWIAGPSNQELVSLIPSNVKVDYVTEIDGVAHVSFSKEFLETNVGSGPEQMLLQQVALLMKQFGYNETQILIEGEIREMLFGHIDTNVPIQAMDPNQIEKLTE
ncbi:GerMN domain-containing protein [Alkalihalobacterium sp. APHAB7]|uniref:GerMN domain-containing protein n=1 Tax=Alkalihalobacterium sp. APHAB7 TaxID=3402081 RepID=UPI003AAE18C1